MKIRQSKLRTLKPNEPGFLLTDGLILAPRAGFEISNRCPKEYKMILQECLQYGWIKPIATVYDHEIFWNTLRE